MPAKTAKFSRNFYIIIAVSALAVVLFVLFALPSILLYNIDSSISGIIHFDSFVCEPGGYLVKVANLNSVNGVATGNILFELDGEPVDVLFPDDIALIGPGESVEIRIIGFLGEHELSADVVGGVADSITLSC